MNNQLYCGLCYLERFMQRRSLGSLMDRCNKESLMTAGHEKILQKIQQSTSYYSKGGAKVWAQGIANLLNYKRRTRRIDNLIGSSDGVAHGEE